MKKILSLMLLFGNLFIVFCFVFVIVTFLAYESMWASQAFARTLDLGAYWLSFIVIFVGITVVIFNIRERKYIWSCISSLITLLFLYHKFITVTQNW